MQLLHLSAPFSLTPQQLVTWQSAFDESVAIDDPKSTELRPLELVVALRGSYEPRDVNAGIVAAFARIGVVDGTVEIALSEHDGDDLELETPPFYQGQLDLAHGPEPEPALAQVELQIMQSEPFTDAQLTLLGRELRAHLPWPIASFVAVSPSLPGRHFARLALVAMPEAQLPERAALKAATARALAAAQYQPLRVKIGAYVGTWDQTLFDDTF